MRIENDYTNLTVNNYLDNYIKNSEKRDGSTDSIDFINSNFKSSQVDNRENLISDFSKMIQKDINDLQLSLQKIDHSKEILSDLENKIREKELEEIKITRADENYKDLMEGIFDNKRGRTTIILEEEGRTSVITIDGGSEDKTIKVSKDKNTGDLTKNISDYKKSEDKFFMDKRIKKEAEEKFMLSKISKEEIEELKDEKVKDLFLRDKTIDDYDEIEDIVEEMVLEEETITMDELYKELETKEKNILFVKEELKESLSSLEEGNLEDDKMIEYLEAKQIFQDMKDTISKEIEIYLANYYNIDKHSVYRLLK